MARSTGGNRDLRISVDPAQGFFDLGLYNDAWAALDELLPENKVDPLIMSLRLDILLALHRLDAAVALGTGACRQWPGVGHFFIKTSGALMALNDHDKAKALLLAAPGSLHVSASYWFDLARCQARTGAIAESTKSLAECFQPDRGLRARALDEPDLEPMWKSL